MLFIYAGIGVAFGFSYTFGIIKLSKSEMAPLLFTFVVGIVLSIAVARYCPIWLGKEGVHYTAGAWLGLVLSYLVLCPLNNYLSDWVVSAILGASMITAAKTFGNWQNMSRRAYPFIGSGLVIAAIGCYLGGFPNVYSTRHSSFTT